MRKFFKEYWLPFIIILGSIFLLIYGMYKSAEKQKYNEENAILATIKILKENKDQECCNLYKIEFDGHTYIFVRNTWNSAGNNFLHDPSCKCLKEEK